MKTQTNPFLAALRAGQPQLGIWISLASNFAAEVVAGAGFDWALIDMEHAPNDLASVLSQLQVFASYRTTAIVRPIWNDAVQVKRLLDLGAEGLLFPMVQSVAEAEKAIAATRYPPRGIRGVSTMTRANQFGRTDDYFTRIEDETAVFLQVETRAAVVLATEIGSVDGASGIFFGPADIGADMGFVGQPMHSQVWEIILPAARKLIAKGIPVGTIVGDLGFARNLLAEGFTFVACGGDAAVLARGVDDILRAMKA